MMKFETIFNDKYGIESTKIFSDGKIMKIKIRDVEFEGHNFDYFEPKNKVEIETFINSFSYKKYSHEGTDHYQLHNCSFQVKIPIKISRLDKEYSSNLKFIIDLNDSIDKYGFQSGYSINNIIFKSDVEDIKFDYAQDFESVLIGINKLLPKDSNVKSCISCRYSGYWIAGNDFFGSLICYKNMKSEYEYLSDKDELLELHNKYTYDDFYNVQETHLCKEFARMEKNTWAYKDWKIK